MALATGVCGTVLTDNLGIALVLVRLEANKAVLHGVLDRRRGAHINFISMFFSLNANVVGNQNELR